MTTDTTPTRYLTFRYLKNVQLDLGDGQLHTIPCTMQHVPNPSYIQRTATMTGAPKQTNDDAATLLMPVFDLTFVHEIILADELPKVPVKLPNMSDGFHEKLADAAYQRAAEAKLRNDTIRKKVASYVRNGTIEVVSDPFANAVEVEGLSDLVDALRGAEADAA